MPINIRCDMDPRMLLNALHCKIGQACRKHPGWWHFRPSGGWTVIRVDDTQLSLNDHNFRARAYLVDGDPPQLSPVCYHHVQVEFQAFAGYAFLVGTIVTSDVQPVYYTYSLAQSLNLAAELARVGSLTVQLFAQYKPDIGDPFAYWPED